MSKGLIVTLAGAIVGCVGLGYILGSREESITEELPDETNGNLIEKSTNAIKEVVEGVKEYMNNKTNTTIETLRFCKDALSDKTCRLALGCAFVGLGGALIASVYIPVPNPA